MRFICIWLLACALGVGSTFAAEFEGRINIGGSTTCLPIIADCASQFMEKYESWN